MNLQEEKNRVGALLGEKPKDVKVVRKNDGLIERMDSHKKLITEDGKQLLVD